jgi:hypothetical protein
VWLPGCVAACAITVPNDPVDPGGGSSTGGTGGSPASEFVGQWTCQTTLQDSQTEPWCVVSPCAASTQASIAQASPNTISTTFGTGSNGICTLAWTVKGTVATLSPANQVCAIGQGMVTITYSAGTLVFTGAGMATVNLMGKYGGTDGPLQGMGTATLLASCQRQ